MMESLNSLKLIVRRKSLLDTTCGFSGFYHRQIFGIQSLHFIKKKSILSNIRSQIFFTCGVDNGFDSVVLAKKK